MKAKKMFLTWFVCLLIIVSCTKNDNTQTSSQLGKQSGSSLPACSSSFMVTKGVSADTIKFSLSGLTCNFGDTCHFSRYADTLLVYSSIVLPGCMDDQIVVINEKSDSIFINIQERYMLADYRCNVVVKVNYGIKIPKANSFNFCILNGVLYKGF